MRELLPALVLVAIGCAPPEQPALPEPEFQSLFDGSTLDGWRGLGREGIPEAHWIVEDGMIRKVASGSIARAADGQVLEGGDLMTVERFEDFELQFEWKLSAAGNSGIKYNVSEEFSTANPPAYGALGFEYQILDDSLHSDGALPSHRVGSLYDLIAAPDSKPIRPVGEFNASRIVWSDGHGEHWLNGEMILSFDLETPEFDSFFAASKYAGFPEMNLHRNGHIVLQDHGDDVWFRNIRIRSLTP